MVKDAGYEYVSINASGEDDLCYLKDKLKDNITLLAGPSGVGKSTLLNGNRGDQQKNTKREKHHQAL
jgi:ribosome biogenesis GTPase / thiamine phosphate phosphatase